MTTSYCAIDHLSHQPPQHTGNTRVIYNLFIYNIGCHKIKKKLNKLLYNDMFKFVRLHLRNVYYRSSQRNHFFVANFCLKCDIMTVTQTCRIYWKERLVIFNRIPKPIMSKYELVRIMATRATQISEGA